ncbi:urea transporter [Corynebacterium bovis]|uniref:Urea transporter n=1 Tax=Corynebacterium bovis DSM 20582 = CIP 54.80 TaxID=927655 RepID=A0A8H9Y5Z2_9CORY|nr:urea transporter [Corynebacterium bovis]MBB3114963.1 urea transporter [Corynebacterium bovis DSM 20582 = CIP 54.80]QQC48046.1 urea transporter [Corynebacterium bovis]
MNSSAVSMAAVRRGVRGVPATVLNGFSQIFLAGGPWCGLLILVGLAHATRPGAAMAVLGSVVALVATVGDRFPGRRGGRDVTACPGPGEWQGIRQGLAGYNGALIGVACWMTWQETEAAVVATVLGALAGVVVTRLLTQLFAAPGIREPGLPVLTAPFCVASGLFAVLGAQYVPPEPVPPLPAGGAVTEAVEAVLGNVSEVMLVDDPLTGVLVLVGLAVASWRIGLAALLGAVGEYLFGLATGQDPDKLIHGLLGYSGVLVTIALGAVFVTGPLWVRVAAAVVGLLLSQATAGLMVHLPVPTYTWPFIVPVWVVLIVLWAGRTWRAARRT